MEIRYNNFKSNLILSCLVLSPFFVLSQGVKNNGASISITSGTYFIVNSGGFFNTSVGNSQVKNAGTIDVDGDWINDNATNVFGTTPTATTGGVVRLDGAAQNIGGTQETRFYNLEVKGTGRKTLTLTGTPPLATGARVFNDLKLNGQSLSLNSRTLTIENTAPTAINGTGKLISETGPVNGGYGVVKWLTPSNLVDYPKSYTIPFGTDAPTPIAIPFQYNVTNPGTPAPGGTGAYKTFATYGTDNANSFDETNNPNIATGPFTPYPNSGTPWSNLPYSVTHLTDDYIQASHKWVVDRFWIIDEGNLGNGVNPALSAGAGYSSKPKSEYVFTWAPSEIGGTNHITASKLVPQRWNHTANKWGDWLYGVPSFINPNPYTKVTIQIAQDAGTWQQDMFPVWTLVDNSDPLPIELVRFAGQCADGKTEIRWSTYTETNNDFFTVERSNNGTDFEIVDVIQGAGNSNQPLTYNVTDNLPYGGTSYYRLKNTDLNGKSEYSEIIAVTCGTDGNDFNFVNAYDVNHTEIVVEFTGAENEKFNIMLYDASGRRALDFQGAAVEGMNKVRLPSGDLARGIYIINLSNNIKNFSKRVMLH